MMFEAQQKSILCNEKNPQEEEERICILLVNFISIKFIMNAYFMAIKKNKESLC